MNNLAIFHAPSALSRLSYKLQLISLMLTGVAVLPFGTAKTTYERSELGLAVIRRLRAQGGYSGFPSPLSVTEGPLPTAQPFRMGIWTHTKRGFFHDGRFATLDDVVRHYDNLFGLGLSDQQVHDVVEYLKSLSQQLPAGSLMRRLTKVTGLRQERVINQEIGGQPILVVHQPSSDTTTAFIARVKGTPLKFRAANADATEPIDEQTKSRWNLYGNCISGAFKGSQLTSLILEPEYWFAWSEFHPDTKIYAATEPKR
jgi:uncharacterized protein DUF3179